ncbi:hypothetical protein J6590_038439 [Homalodisca vitripennis]|nr:hypothetical protein J6590_038439 [Homalodisca vitripennis]
MALTLLLLLSLLGAPVRAQLSVFQSVLEYYRAAVNIPPGAASDTSVFQKEYDFVVVGAGSGGSVVANRLSEVPDWSILLLEAGKEEILLTDIPLLVSYILATDYNWGYKTQPQPGMCLSMEKQRCNWHRGKGMGGTSIINYMVYSRGSKRDFDNWERLGNPGWSYEDVLPYFRKSENINIPQLRDSPYHGTGGYLNVDKAHWATPLGKLFINALKDRGYPLRDTNNPNPIGVYPVLSTTVDGARLSASKAFIRPVRARRNLFVGKEARVTRILIDSKTNKTFGVEFVKNRRTYVVRAKKEVILSAGSLNSPQLLMLSGIGPRDHLEDLGIPVISDLKVGYNLQDHVSMAGLAFQVNDSITIVESRYFGPQYFLDYMLNGNGPYTMPGGAEAVAFTRTKYNNDTDQPDMELVMGPGSFMGDTGGSLRQSFNIREDVFNKIYGSRMGQDGFGIVPILLQPKSRGRVKLKSRNPFHWPLLYPNYFSDPRDVQVLVEGLKQATSVIYFKESHLSTCTAKYAVRQGARVDDDGNWNEVMTSPETAGKQATSCNTVLSSSGPNSFEDHHGIFEVLTMEMPGLYGMEY